jgi:hypothetical protein
MPTSATIALLPAGARELETLRVTIPDPVGLGNAIRVSCAVRYCS